MQDSFGRNINYMRISLTDRCNYACYYCKPDISKHLCHSDILTYEQLLDICRCAITLGITRFKITGGEPTLRKGYIDFILIKDKTIALRYIELMPLKYSDRNSKMNELIEYVQKNYTLNAYNNKLGNGPAHYYTIPEFQGYIGFIEALHNKFCGQCNRVRLSSVGRLKLCLFHSDGVDLKPYLNDLEELEKVMKEWIFKKPKEHHFEEEHSSTVMNEIGG